MYIMLFVLFEHFCLLPSKVLEARKETNIMGPRGLCHSWRGISNLLIELEPVPDKENHPAELFNLNELLKFFRTKMGFSLRFCNKLRLTSNSPRLLDEVKARSSTVLNHSTSRDEHQRSVGV